MLVWLDKGGFLMRFWRNNRLDAEFDMPIEKLVEEFEASKYESMLMPLERKVSLFLSDPDGPVSGTWELDDPDYDRLLDLIAERATS